MCIRTVWGILILALLGGDAMVMAEPTNGNAFGVLTEGYIRNRESFPVIDCQFRYRKGSAESLSEALKGNFDSDSVVANGSWIVDGEKVRYELLCDRALAADAERRIESSLQDPDESRLQLPFIDREYLRDGTYSLRYGPMTLVANLFRATDPDPLGIRITPFNLDFMGADEYSNPVRYFQACKDRRFVGQFEGVEVINQREALVVTVRYDNGMVKLGFDPKRNYLLVYQSDQRDGLGKMYEVFVTEARECTGQRWFPMRCLKAVHPDAVDPVYEDLGVTKLDVDNKPRKERFALTLAQGVQVSVIGRPEWVNIAQQEVVPIESLRLLDDRCRDNGRAYLARRERSRKAQEAVGASTTGWAGGWRSALIILNIFVVVALASIVFVKRTGTQSE